jgi:hypothetical protein
VQVNITLCAFERNNATDSGAGVQAQEDAQVSCRQDADGFLQCWYQYMHLLQSKS